MDPPYPFSNSFQLFSTVLQLRVLEKYCVTLCHWTLVVIRWGSTPSYLYLYLCMYLYLYHRCLFDVLGLQFHYTFSSKNSRTIQVIRISFRPTRSLGTRAQAEN